MSSFSSAIINDQMGRNGFVWFHGVVEDVDDPLKMGRVRVRCVEYHTYDKQLMPTESLPWATPIQPVTSASVSGKGSSPTGLLTGTWVIGFFRDGYNCQDPIVLGSFAGFPQPINGTTGQYSNPNEGFNDPEGKWPSSVTGGEHQNPGYGGEPDTNRLARNQSIEKTIVKQKNDTRVNKVNTAIHPWLTWDEPESPYAAEYPKNHVIETESGHIIELDDTKGKERINVHHKAGTWIEIHPNGSKVQKIVGDDYEIALSDKKLLVKGNCYMNTEGAVTALRAGKDFYIEIGGDAHMLVNGNVVMETMRNFEHRVHGTYTVASNGNMMFVAPRIDFNPEGVNPDKASNPKFSSGKNVSTTLKKVVPEEKIVNAKTTTQFVSTDYVKNLNSTGVTGVSDPTKAIEQATKTYTNPDGSLAEWAPKQEPSFLESAQKTLNDIGSGIEKGIQGLQKEVGGFLGGIGEGIQNLGKKIGIAEGDGPIPSGLNMGTLSSVGTALGFGGVGGGLGSIGGAVGGFALALFDPAAAIQAVNLGANIATAVAPSPSSYAKAAPQGTSNISGTPLPPVSAGLAAGGQSVADTNLATMAAPGIPTESLYAVPGGSATLISGYPGRTAGDSGTTGIPAIPIVAFQSEFPSMKPTESLEVDGGEF